ERAAQQPRFRPVLVLGGTRGPARRPGPGPRPLLGRQESHSHRNALALLCGAGHRRSAARRGRGLVRRLRQLMRAAVLISSLILVAGCAPCAPGTQLNSPNSPTDGPPREHVLTASIETEPAFIAGLAPAAGLAATDF